MDQIAHGFGGEVRRRRLALGLSLTALSKKIHYSRGHLSKIETGKRAPSPQLAAMIDTALKAGGVLAALVDDPVRDDLDSPCDVPIDHPEPALLNVVDLPPDLAGATAMHGDSIAVAFDRNLVQIRRLGQHVCPGAIFPVLEGSLRSLRAMLANATGPARLRLLTTAARYAEYFGWMQQEAGNEAAALAWTGRAVYLSRESGRVDMQSYALVRHALIRLYHNDGTGTVELARQAQADRQVPARVLGLAALREGQGHALNRDYESFRTAMARAEELLRVPDEDPETVPLGTSTVADPARMATGWSLYHLGRPADGAAILEEELTQLPPDAPRSYGRYAARCALQYVVCGEIDRACAITAEMLPRIADVVSATILADLCELSRQLTRRREHKAVRGVLPDLTSAIHRQHTMIGVTAHE